MTKIKDKMKSIFLGRDRKPQKDEQGRIICDPKPLLYPTGVKRPPTREEQLTRILQRHNEMKAYDERYEDETDFDIDEPDMLSPYERNAMVYAMEPELPPSPTPSERGASEPQNSGEQPSPSSSDEKET